MSEKSVSLESVSDQDLEKDIENAIAEMENMKKLLDNKVSNIRLQIIKHVTNGDMAIEWLEKYINLDEYCSVNDFISDGYIDICHGGYSETYKILALVEDFLEPYFEIGDTSFTDGHVCINITLKKKD